MITDSSSYTSFLQEELAKRIRHNPQYSMRAFAKLLKLSPGELSEVLRGKRKLSVKAVWKIAKALGLSSAETRHLAFLVQKESGKLDPSDHEGASSSETLRKREVSLDMFNILSDWYCFGILNLTECEGFKWDEKWISKRLGVSVAEIAIAIKRLERVGMIEQKNGKRMVVQDYLISPDGVPSEAIRNYHRQMLTKAIHSLELQQIGERENTGIGFAVDPKQIPSIKKEISQFLDEIVEKYGQSKKRKEVYQCEVALFRLTSGEK